MKLGDRYSIIYQPIEGVSLADIRAIETYLDDSLWDLQNEVPASCFYGGSQRLAACGVSNELRGAIYEAVMQNADRIVFIGG